MSLFSVIAILVTLSALFAYVNHRWLRLPRTIGLMLIALVLSLGLVVLGRLGVNLEPYAERVLERVSFSDTLLQGMLSFLLFAGALHIELGELLKRKAVIGLLATVGVVTSTFLVGTASYYAFGALGLGIPLMMCLLFGSLIAPTDPIAVLSILKTAKAPKALETKIAGESLFNDGIAVVVFIVMLELATGSKPLGAGDVVRLLAQEALGGALLGLVCGWVAYWLLRGVDDYHVEVLITLALVTGGYALAMGLHVSGPIAVVIAGLLIGNQGRKLAMSDTTREHLDTFWELIDEILNAVLFVLIGLEVLLFGFSRGVLLGILVAIPITLLARFVSVGLPIAILRRSRRIERKTTRILTWGGLRGGISVALALTIPPGPHRDAIVTITYGVVVFSILVQGLTIKKLIPAVEEAAAESLRE
jgi:monovalent cation:H+ antiporter, CPA1 family